MLEGRDHVGPLLAEAQSLASFGVWRWDVVTNALAWSEGLYGVLGLGATVIPTFDAWIGQIDPDDQPRVRDYFADARRTGGPLDVEYRIRKPDGSVRTLLGRVRGQFESSQLVALAGMEQDITHVRELTTRVAFSDRMISLGTLAGGLAHEINNPLATIAANLTLLAQTQSDDDSVRDALVATERIRTIVRGVMAFSRIDDARREPVDIPRLVDLALSLVGTEIRVRARLVKELGETPTVLANNARLGHVLINLLSNAAHAIPTGRADDHEVRVTTSTDPAGWASIEVTDTGVGIPLAMQHRIFDPFFTTKPTGEGTGLGLAVCHGIVRSHGGNIAVRSQVGRGSTFTVTLPPASVRRVPSSTNAPPVDASGPRARVLLVDDDARYATSLSRLLRQTHDVTIITDGREALTRLLAGETFDVILCDLMMPEVSGQQLFTALSDRRPDQAARVIFVTGGAYTAASQAFIASVSNPVLEKPCDFRDLRAEIQRIAQK